MKRLIPILLAVLLLTACSPSPDTPETTLPDFTAPPETTVLSDPLEEMLAEMTLRQKVGQLFLIRPDALDPAQTQEQILDPYAAGVTEMPGSFADMLAQYPAGGIVLFAKNLVSPGQLSQFIRELQSVSSVPLFLAVDEEGGLVARLANHDAFDLPRFQNAAAVGLSGDIAEALDMGRTIGTYLRQYGFNLDFAPVADVNTNPENPVIGSRSFSSDPQIAARMVAAFAEGLNENGVIATFKHFPGHGDTAEDSHSGLAVTDRTLEELSTCEFLPFLEAGSRDLVMIGHIALPNITGDMTPATLSRQIVTGILREELGFEGLIITDSMEMGAIVETYGSAEAAVAALQAGCDIILMPEDLPEAFEAVLAALEEGSLTMEWLDETVRRILEFKALHGIITF